jgi:hypothetical protein
LLEEPRLVKTGVSVEERYTDYAGYVAAVRKAAADSIAQLMR